ncbi:MAG: response regulator [Planktomarina sp.]|nr:response regulator [Planktomarina sp.]
MPHEPISIYVVDGDPRALDVQTAVLSAEGYATIPCGSAEQFLKLFDPDLKACVVMELHLPGMSGSELQDYLASNGLDIPIVILTAHGDVPIAVQTLRVGAVDFIEKPAADSRLLEAIGTASELIFDRKPNRLPQQIIAQRLRSLTNRERQVLEHLLKGKLNKEIAVELNVSQRTIEAHRARIREKTRTRGIVDLIRMFG